MYARQRLISSASFTREFNEPALDQRVHAPFFAIFPRSTELLHAGGGADVLRLLSALARRFHGLPSGNRCCCCWRYRIYAPTPHLEGDAVMMTSKRATYDRLVNYYLIVSVVASLRSFRSPAGCLTSHAHSSCGLSSVCSRTCWFMNSRYVYPSYQDRSVTRTS